MNGDEERDVAARLTELEATVRGLTQELVSAEERIRQLEAALESSSDAEATKDTRAESQPDDETVPEDGGDDAGADLDDIIVA